MALEKAIALTIAQKSELTLQLLRMALVNETERQLKNNGPFDTLPSPLRQAKGR